MYKNVLELATPDYSQNHQRSSRRSRLGRFEGSGEFGGQAGDLDTGELLMA